MRKILFIILIILLLVGAGLLIINGLELGNFKVWGIRDIIAKNDNIDQKNQELSNLVSITYPGALEALNTSSETLTSTKKEYEDKSVLVSNNKYYMQTEKYEIEFLWTKLGNYAKDNNVQIKIDVVNSVTEDLYDLKFTITGAYIDVTDFIYDIENDSKLGFKIEEFHMSANKNGVTGTFSCKEIGINIEKVDENSETTEQEGTNVIDTDVKSTESNSNSLNTNVTTNTTVTDTDNTENQSTTEE